MSRRHCFGLLLLGTLLLAPGLSAAAPPARTATAPRGAATTASPAARSVFDCLLDLLDHLWGARGGSGHGAAAAAPALHNVHAGSGCGIDPNGCH
jgi:hypothetical protein